MRKSNSVAEPANGAPPSGTVELEYFNKASLADFLKKSARTIDRFHARRMGPPRTIIGRTVLYRKESVLEWLRSLEDDGRPRARGSRASR